jgi:hypothetical protein
MQLYLHEFTHTVEMYLENYWDNVNTNVDYHGVLGHYGRTVGLISPGLGVGYDGCISEIEVIRLFLLNQAIVNGETVGIPNEF